MPRRKEPDPDAIVTPQELAAELRIPVGTIYAWRSYGTGPKGFKAGRAVRYYRRDIDQWLADGGSARIGDTAQIGQR